MNGDSQGSRRRSPRHNGFTNGKKRIRRPVPRPHETEEEAIIRRFHDAQRMARFRAKKRKAAEEAKSLESAKKDDVNDVIFKIMEPAAEGRIDLKNIQEQEDILRQSSGSKTPSTLSEQNRYSQLLEIIEEIGRDIRLSYAGSRSSIERLKLGIVQARTLVTECLFETWINSR